jgi:4-aminobutyrate aminotransferase-like enzyme
MHLVKYRVPGPKSTELLALSGQYEPPRTADQVPLVWDHAEDVWVDGNRYLDFASAAALAVIGIMEEGRLPENARVIGACLLKRLNDLNAKHERLGAARGISLAVGMEILENEATKAPSSANGRTIILEAA